VARERFLATAPAGLEAALAADHHISRDLDSKLTHWGSLSEKQVAFAFKLAKEVEEKKTRPAEKLVPAPVSDKRLTVRGVLVSSKSFESDFGTCTKMTVKVETPEGNWLAWGSLPATLSDANVGDTVEFDGKLKTGR